MTTIETWMPQARQIAAQCWCDEETKGIVMDMRLAEAVARRIASWMEASAEAHRGCDYYRKLLVSCGEIIGEAARIADDGSKAEGVLVAKVPELVRELAADKARLDWLQANPVMAEIQGGPNDGTQARFYAIGAANGNLREALDVVRAKISPLARDHG